jgi:hypothetical protein
VAKVLVAQVFAAVSMARPSGGGGEIAEFL